MGDSQARISIFADDKASATIKSVQGGLAGIAQGAKTSILTGVGLGAGITAFAMTQRAVGAVTDAIQGMVQSAIEDESSVARLTAALHANVPGWDGNTDAIERTIAASERLGFTDDETRASLTFLTAATHDVTKAQELHNTAMDLARFKGISLQSASEALVKVEAGRYRILASLGIQLREGATATEALAAVQAVAAGQAEDFGETTAGAMLAAQVALEEAGEEIGRELLPLMKGLADFTLNSVVPAINGLIDGLKTLGPVLGPLGDIFRTAFVPGAVAAENLMTAAEEMATRTAASGVTTSNNWIAMGNAIAAETEETTGVIVDEFGAMPGESAAAMLRGETELVGAVEELLRITAEAMTPSAQRASAIGFLTSDAYSAAIASGKPAAIARANELWNAAVTTLHNTSGVNQAGRTIGGHWIQGITSSIYNGYYSVANAGASIRNLLGHSLPTEGPLKGNAAERGGMAIGEAWATAIGTGIRANMPTLALPGLAGGGGGFSGGAMTPAAAGGGEIHTHVYLDGREIAEAVSRNQYYQAPAGPGRLPR
jgi:hypothetical protein